MIQRVPADRAHSAEHATGVVDYHAGAKGVRGLQSYLLSRDVVVLDKRLRGLARPPRQYQILASTCQGALANLAEAVHNRTYYKFDEVVEVDSPS